MDKRTFLKTGILGLGGLIIAPTLVRSAISDNTESIEEIIGFTLPSLP